MSLREEINSIACDDFCDPKLTEWELNFIINKVLDAVVEAVEQNRGLLPKVTADKVVSTSDELSVQYYHAGVDAAKYAIQKLRGE